MVSITDGVTDFILAGTFNGNEYQEYLVGLKTAGGYG